MKKDQSLAIAYGVQSKNKKKKKMAEGGEVKDDHSQNAKALEDAGQMDMQSAPALAAIAQRRKKMAEGGEVSESDDQKSIGKRINYPGMAEGGEVEASDLMNDDERAGSIADAIMRKRAKNSSQVDIELNAQEDQSPNFDERNEDAAMKENYDEDLMSVSQPMDSNEHGHDIDSDKHDMISRIRSKIKARGR